MKNKYFSDEDIEANDLYFVCYMIERVARRIKQKNKYVVNTIGRDGLYHLLSCAGVLHCENPLKVEEDWMLTSRPSRVVANQLYQSLGFEKRETNVYKMKF